MDRIIKEFADESAAYAVASKMVKIDLMSMTLMEWLDRPASEIIMEYLTTAEAASSVALNNLRSHSAGEQLLDELGFHEQHNRLIFDDAIDKFRDSMLGTIESLGIYMMIHERANEQRDKL